LGGAATVTANDASDADAVPSETEITMPEYVPTLVLVGVPVSAPVDVLKLAQAGLPEILNVNALPSGSEAVGWNAYDEPTVTLAAGVPEITGALLGGASTVTLKGASDEDIIPSDTEIAIPE
jgi:hypothetical protein